MLEKVILGSVIFTGIVFSICYMIARIVDLKSKLEVLKNDNEILKHKVQNQAEVIKLQRGVR